MRRALDVVPEAKTGAYLDFIVALRAAHAAQATEAIVVDPEGWVLEATASNVFAVLGDPAAPRLVTPPEGALLPGITRAAVMSAARARGLPLEARPLSLAELLGASEVFLTSSVRELVAVVRLDGQAVGSGLPGPVRRRLHEAYRASSGGEVALPPPP
jgi:branched-chain amino acid aminotransferase